VSGKRGIRAFIVILDGKLPIAEGHIGNPNIHLTADSETWIGFLRKERSLFRAFIRGKVRLRGSPKLLLAFGRCISI
jgi:putative sterol carrier protein